MARAKMPLICLYLFFASLGCSSAGGIKCECKPEHSRFGIRCLIVWVARCGDRMEVDIALRNDSESAAHLKYSANMPALGMPLCWQIEVITEKHEKAIIGPCSAAVSYYKEEIRLPSGASLVFHKMEVPLDGFFCRKGIGKVQIRAIFDVWIEDENCRWRSTSLVSPWYEIPVKFSGNPHPFGDLQRREQKH